MSDMMRGGMPPRPMQGGGGMPPGGAASKMSVFNPTDMAGKVGTGAVNPNMTIEEFLNKNFGVSARDPLTKLIEATKGQAQNATMQGKLGMQPGMPQGPQGAPSPQARPQARPPIGGLDDLVNRM